MTGCAPCRDTGAVTGADGLAWPCPECGEHEFPYTRSSGPCDAPACGRQRSASPGPAGGAPLAGKRTPGQYQDGPGDTGMDVSRLRFLPAATRGQLTPAAHSSAAGAFSPQPDGEMADLTRRSELARARKAEVERIMGF